MTQITCEEQQYLNTARVTRVSDTIRRLTAEASSIYNNPGLNLTEDRKEYFNCLSRSYVGALMGEYSYRELDHYRQNHMNGETPQDVAKWDAFTTMMALLQSKVIGETRVGHL